MCGSFKFRKLRARLKKYEKQKDEAYYQLENVVDSLGCGICECYDNGTVKSFEDRFASCNCKRRDVLVSLAVNADRTQSEAIDFLENKYAYEVFKFYTTKQPNLIRNSTGEVVTWKDAFGDNFDSVEKSLRHSLVGLIEGTGRYRFK